MSIPWEEFVVTNVRVVLDAAQRVLANTADAEDVAQEVFLEIHRTNRLAEFASAPGLLRTMATRRALDRLRRRRATTGLQQLDLPSREPDPSEQAHATELDRQLREALAELPPREAEVFCLCVFEGLETRAIAHSLNVSTNAVAKSLCTARARLAKAMGIYRSETSS